MVTIEQIMEIIKGFRQNKAPLGYRMMSPEQNDKVNLILMGLEKKLGADYLQADDATIIAEAEKLL